MTSLGKTYSSKDFAKDLSSGTVVFLIALPLCLGISLASGAPLFSGILSGIIGGIIIGTLSGSHTSVSGPAAGLTVVVAGQIAILGTFEAFLCAVMLAGMIQVLLAYIRAGTLSAFFPTSVINGLLAAIGIILVLKQIPHLVGHDVHPQGDMAFKQANTHNTFSELLNTITSIHPGAAAVGILSLLILIAFARFEALKKLPIQSPLLVVALGVFLKTIMDSMGEPWAIQTEHLVQVPVFTSGAEFFAALMHPDFSVLRTPQVYISAITIAIIASLETLLNLEAVDKIDNRKRFSPPNRELFAQGVGNFTAGLIGAIPTTSVIVRSSVNVNSGSVSKLSSVIHGVFLLLAVLLIPQVLNLIPLASLAAILVFTGYKLASYALFQRMWSQGRLQFLPFLITLTSIVLTDLLVGVIIGLAVTLLFILISNLRQPVRQIKEKHLGGNILRVELANQVSFLNRASLEKIFKDALSSQQHMLIDAERTDYIDPDILSLIQEFRCVIAPAHGVTVSVKGFKDHYDIEDEVCFVDYSTRELQEKITPSQVLTILKEGNRRFISGQLLNREFDRQIVETSRGQHPLAVILSCIDSRNPAEIIFDLGIGDIFSVRIAGNIIGQKILGSMEFATAIAGSKLIVVLGHTKCGAITASVDLYGSDEVTMRETTGCQHIDWIIKKVHDSMTDGDTNLNLQDSTAKEELVNEVAKRNVLNTLRLIPEQSQTIKKLIQEKKIGLIGGMYNVRTGKVEFFDEHATGINPPE